MGADGMRSAAWKGWSLKKVLSISHQAAGEQDNFIKQIKRLGLGLQQAHHSGALHGVREIPERSHDLECSVGVQASRDLVGKQRPDGPNNHFACRQVSRATQRMRVALILSCIGCCVRAHVHAAAPRLACRHALLLSATDAAQHGAADYRVGANFQAKEANHELQCKDSAIRLEILVSHHCERDPVAG